MRDVSRVVWCGGLAAAIVIGLARPAAQEPQVLEPPVGVFSEELPSLFAGTWDYNAAESINIVTGRPEQSPRSAIQRGGAGRGAATPQTGRSTSGGGGGGGEGGRGGIRGSGVGPTPEMMRETRDMSRDLLEVPEALRITLDSGAITFKDDIERERTYTLDGRRKKYRLGASEFNARVAWTGTQLRKDIEGSFGFRMSETYFLSPDGRRLFVIIRVGTASRNTQPSGFNRVYDRVESTPAPERVSSR